MITGMQKCLFGVDLGGPKWWLSSTWGLASKGPTQASVAELAPTFVTHTPFTRAAFRRNIAGFTTPPSKR
jgi:hypothetical protein